MGHLLAIALLSMSNTHPAASFKEFEGKWTGTAVIRDLDGNEEKAKVALIVAPTLGGRFYEARSAILRKKGKAEVLELFEVPQQGREIRHWRFTSTGDAFPYLGELSSDGKSLVLNRSEKSTGTVRMTWERKRDRLDISIEMLVGGQTIPLVSMELEKPKQRSGY